MGVLAAYTVEGFTRKKYFFLCPACDQLHTFDVDPEPTKRPNWTFNGNFEKPTFTPSLLYPDKKPRCHLFVTDGKIHYCSDCEHSMAGKIVDMQPCDLPVV